MKKTIAVLLGLLCLLMAAAAIFVVIVLIVLAGISCSLTRSNLRRGIKTLLLGLLATVLVKGLAPLTKQ